MLFEIFFQLLKEVKIVKSEDNGVLLFYIVANYKLKLIKKRKINEFVFRILITVWLKSIKNVENSGEFFRVLGLPAESFHVGQWS